MSQSLVSMVILTEQPKLGIIRPLSLSMRTADPNAPTKEKLLDAAMKLMLAQGFEATSVDEIIAEADATKGSLFHFFKSKEDLAKAALERFVSRQLGMFQAAPFQNEKDPRARVLGWIDATIAAFQDPAMPKSCLLGNFSQELAPTHPDFQSLCAQGFSRSAEGFARDLSAAGRGDAAHLADLFLTIIQGSMILVKAKKDVSIGVENMRHFRSYIEGLLAPAVRRSPRRTRR